MNVSGGASIDGDLSIVRKKSFKPGNGTLFGLLDAASRSGEFDRVIKAKIVKSRYFRPAYSATGVALEVDTATIAVSPESGPRNTPVQLDGSRFVPGEPVSLSFTDENGTKTSLGSANADGSGELSVARSVPSNAELGRGKFTAKSTVTAIAASKAFDVTG